MAYKSMSMKQFTEACIEAAEHYDDPMHEQAAQQQVLKMREDQERNAIAEAMNAPQVRWQRRDSFNESTKVWLIKEALNRMLESCIDESVMQQPHADLITRTLVGNFVEDTGVYQLESSMAHGSELLYQVGQCIKRTHKAIMEEADPAVQSSFSISPEMKDSFYQELDDIGINSIGQKIRDLVMDAESDFVNTAAEEHKDVVFAMQRAENKMAEVDDDKDNADEIKESYLITAKQKANQLRHRPKSFFSTLVHEMSSCVLKNPDMQKEFMEAGHLDMSKIIERVGMMYTFMEMVNSTGLVRVDERYIQESIQSLRA